MLPSMAAPRSSSSFCIRGRTTRQNTARMTMKHTADQMMSYQAGISGLGAASSACSAANTTRAFSILSPYVESAGSEAEDEAGGDTDEGRGLGEGWEERRRGRERGRTGRTGW